MIIFSGRQTGWCDLLKLIKLYFKLIIILIVFFPLLFNKNWEILKEYTYVICWIQIPHIVRAHLRVPFSIEETFPSFNLEKKNCFLFLLLNCYFLHNSPSWTFPFFYFWSVFYGSIYLLAKFIFIFRHDSNRLRTL